MKKHNSFGYVLAALAVMVAALVFAGVAYILLGSGYKTKNSNKDTETVRRTKEILNVTDPGDSIDEAVRRGMMSVGDYIVSSMTSSEYLLANKSDSDFANDIAYIIYGSEKSDDKVKTIEEALASRSRKYVLNKLLVQIDPKYAMSLGTPDEVGSRINRCEITKPLHGDNGYTIGIRQVEGNFDVEGHEVRTDFYVDGVLYRASIKHDPEDGNKFKVSWDTSGVYEGLHDVTILLRSSDGRGYVAEGGDVLIPHCMEITNKGVSKGSILPGSEDSWYAVGVGEGEDCYVNFVDLKENIIVGLYDVCGNLIGENDFRDTPYQVLRGKAQDIKAVEESTGIDGLRNIYYVLVRRAKTPEEDAMLKEIEYKMVQSPEVAYLDGQYYAVDKDSTLVLPTEVPVKDIDESVDDIELRLTDLSGNEITKTVSEVSILPINGFLNSLKLKEFGFDNEVDFFPAFGSEDMFYGFYCDGSPSTVALEAEPLEGYAASIEMSCTNNVARTAVEPGQSINLIPGETELEIKVNSFAGNARKYRIFILNGEDKDGFVKRELKGFPQSYLSGLWMLHSIHPNYVFKPYNTGLDFFEVLDKEDNKDRNLANVNSHPGWVVSDSPVYDGGGWMQAQNDVVAYFLDPRNFLDPEHVFQFEQLSFEPSSQTVEGVKSMIEGSFMDTDEIDYATIIYEAGKTAHISPYLLASRIIQEMGYNGESLLCHGTLEGYEGYYNFFNIGSTPDPNVKNGALINGAKYAKWGSDAAGKKITEDEEALMLPWDSVDKAITGGALWLASKYIGIGQDTLYFQKFDVIDNDDGLYQHQYAQNVSMPYSEGRRYFRSYVNSGMIDQGFVFSIPVYRNMFDVFGEMPDPN